jgi:hypothetical protein
MFLRENPKLMQQLEDQIRARASQDTLKEKERGKDKVMAEEAVSH